LDTTSPRARKKSGELTISQCADAIQKLFEREVEGIITRTQMKELAGRLSLDIELTRSRNGRSRVSATRARVRKLAAIGINSRRLPSCDWRDLTL
jgi:hypothetical protein